MRRRLVAACLAAWLGAWALPGASELEAFRACIENDEYIDFTFPVYLTPADVLPPCVAKCPDTMGTTTDGYTCAWVQRKGNVTSLRFVLTLDCHDSRSCAFMATAEARAVWLQSLKLKVAHFCLVAPFELQAEMMYWPLSTYSSSLKDFYIARSDEAGFPQESLAPLTLGGAAKNRRLQSAATSAAPESGNHRWLQADTIDSSNTTTTTTTTTFKYSVYVAFRIDSKRVGPTQRISTDIQDNYVKQMNEALETEFTMQGGEVVSMPKQDTAYSIEGKESFRIVYRFDGYNDNVNPLGGNYTTTELPDETSCREPCHRVDETANIGGSGVCQSACDCNGQRECGNRGYCVGETTSCRIDQLEFTILTTTENNMGKYGEMDPMSLTIPQIIDDPETTPAPPAPGYDCFLGSAVTGIGGTPFAKYKRYKDTVCESEHGHNDLEDPPGTSAVWPGEAQEAQSMTPIQCQQRCNTLEECNGFQFRWNHMEDAERGTLWNGTGKCYRKGGTYFLPQFRCRNLSISHVEDLYMQETTIKDCMDYCNNHPTCTAYEYHYESEKCFLISLVTQAALRVMALKDYDPTQSASKVMYCMPHQDPLPPAEEEKVAPLAQLKERCLGDITSLTQAFGKELYLGPCQGDIRLPGCSDVACMVIEVAGRSPNCYDDVCADYGENSNGLSQFSGWLRHCPDQALLSQLNDTRWSVCGLNITMPTTQEAYDYISTAQTTTTSSPADKVTWYFSFWPVVVGIPTLVCMASAVMMLGSKGQHLYGARAKATGAFEMDPELAVGKVKNADRRKVMPEIPQAPEAAAESTPEPPDVKSEWWREAEHLAEFKSSAKSFLAAWEKAAAPKTGARIPGTRMRPDETPPTSPFSMATPAPTREFDYARTAENIREWARRTAEQTSPEGHGPRTAAAFEATRSQAFAGRSADYPKGVPTTGGPPAVPQGTARQMEFDPPTPREDARMESLRPSVTGVLGQTQDGMGDSTPVDLALRLARLRVEMPLAQRRRFFLAQCLRWHPDKNAADIDRATRMFQVLQEKKDWFLADTGSAPDPVRVGGNTSRQFAQSRRSAADLLGETLNARRAAQNTRGTRG